MRKTRKTTKKALPRYYRDKALFFTGAGGRNRTDTEQAPLDFESSASTSFTTPAKGLSCCNCFQDVGDFRD